MLKKFTKLINEIEFITDPGIEIEIEDSWTDESDKIEEFKLSVIDDIKYVVEIKFKEYSSIDVFNEFIQFFTFIQYRDYNFYYKEEFLKMTKYTLISAREDMKGFCCEIIFK